MDTNIKFSAACKQKSIKMRPTLCLGEKDMVVCRTCNKWQNSLENTFDRLFGDEAKKASPPRKLTLLEKEETKERYLGRKNKGERLDTLGPVV